jgi:Tfp pilus assembly protein PilF
MWLDHKRLTTARAYALKATEEAPNAKDAWKALAAVHRAEGRHAEAARADARAQN